MALFTCPECGNKVSSFAESCPKCGCPIDRVLAAAIPFQQMDDSATPRGPKMFKESVADRVKQCQLKMMTSSDPEYSRGVALFKQGNITDYVTERNDDSVSVYGTVNNRSLKIVLFEDTVLRRFESIYGRGNVELPVNLLDGEEVALILVYLKAVYSDDDFLSPVPLRIAGLENRSANPTFRSPASDDEDEEDADEGPSTADYADVDEEDADEDENEVDPEDCDPSTEVDDYDEDGCPTEESEVDPGDLEAPDSDPDDNNNY
jgi:hypothetical protein